MELVGSWELSANDNKKTSNHQTNPTKTTHAVTHTRTHARSHAGRHTQAHLKGVVVDGHEEVEEAEAVLGEVLEVLVDHLERHLEDVVEDARHLGHQVLLQLLHRRGEERQHLRVARLGGRAPVVRQHGLEHGRHDLLRHVGGRRLGLPALLDEGREEAEHLLLDPAHGPHVGHARGVLPLRRHGRGHLRRVGGVEVEHVKEDDAELVHEERADGAADGRVGLEDLGQLPHGGRVQQHLQVDGRLLHHALPHAVGQLHEARLHGHAVQRHLRALLREHGADRLVEDVDLVRLQVRRVVPDARHQLLDVGRRLVGLQRHELALALLRDLEEGVAGHVLHARVLFVHELEELRHHGAQELPVLGRAEEAGVLPHHIHDVGGDDGLVVLPALHLAEAEQVLDDRDKEALLLLLAHGARDGADGPAERVEVVPAPLGAVHLLRQLLQHDALRVVLVQVRQVHQRLAHRLVLRDHLRVLGLLPHDVPRLVLHHQHLLRLGHPRDHHHAHARQHGRVQLLPRGGAHARVGRPAQRQWPRARARARAPVLHVAHVEVLREEVPVVEADLEDLLLGHLRDAHQVGHAREQGLVALGHLQALEVEAEEGAEEEREALDEEAVHLVLVVEGRREVRVRRDHRGELLQEGEVQLLEQRLVLRVHVLWFVTSE